MRISLRALLLSVLAASATAVPKNDPKTCCDGTSRDFGWCYGLDWPGTVWCSKEQSRKYNSYPVKCPQYWENKVKC